MFNAEQKETFVKTSYPENRREKVIGLLELFSAYEESWNRDLLQQPITQLQPAFNEITKTISASKAKALLAVLKKYQKWYVSKNANAVCAGVILLKFNTGEKLRDSSMVASPRQLKLILDHVFEDPLRETVDCLYRGFFWIAFAGVPREVAPQITIDEVDFYSLVIRHDGREYKIAAEGLMELRKLCELDTFLFIHKNPDYENRRQRAKGNQLLRGLSDTGVSVTKIADAIYKRFAKTDWSLTYDNIVESGLFYEKYELERFGIEVSFDAEANASDPASSNHHNMICKRYMARYTQWKDIFNL